MLSVVERIPLEPAQERLFERIVEASRSVPREERVPFMFIETMQMDQIQGNGLLERVLGEDVETLVSSGLLAVKNYFSRGGGFSFYIPPGALDYYEALKRSAGGPSEQVETEVQHYLDGAGFRDEFPAAYERWKEAADLLWSADSERELSTIGHKCREAIQEFVTALIEKHNVQGANQDKAKTRDRFSAVIAARREELGDARSDLLDALFNYWRAAGDLIQRQEHAGQREGEPLVWEDGRRAVFQTALLLFEAARTL
jgi:hypothetical protein